jgi:hypothetical protein
MRKHDSLKNNIVENEIQSERNRSQMAKILG